jgi:4-methylaminobutanoate oxidase (formaldehyde-forming)
MDLWVVDIRRFSGLHRDHEWVRERTLEAYGKHYTVAFPHEEYESGRPRLMSPLYKQMRDAGACFGSKLGWERPNWFARTGETPRDIYSMGRQNWFQAVGEEHKAVREAAGLFDQSSFAKFEVKGKDAERALSWICANDVSKPPGRLTYTQMLNSRGGIECDVTVARLGEEHFYIVTGTGFRMHDLAWIAEHIAPGLHTTIEDVTEDYATLSLMGPKARDVLAAVTDADVSNAAFSFGQVKVIRIAGHKVFALRVTYVGELGWELHVAARHAQDVYETVVATGKPQGLRLAGYRAIESLRLEKGYRAWSSDITPNDTPLHAGLGWAVKLRSNTAFLGREAVEAIAAMPLVKRLAGFVTEREDVVLLGRETILRNGEFAGYLTSGGYGYTVGKPIGYGYIRNAAGVSDSYIAEGSYELVVAQERVKASVHMQSIYDPAHARVKS